MNNSKQQAGDHYWQNRYSDLVDKLEQFRSRWYETERLLVRVISRVARATTGLDKSIDPQLARIRILLRKGTGSDANRAELDMVSESLFAAAERSRAEGLSTVPRRRVGAYYARLFDLLRSLMHTREEVATLAAFQRRIDDEGAISDAAFFQELGKVVDGIVSGRNSRLGERKRKPGLIGRLFGGDRKEIDLVAIQGNLIALLEAVDTPLAAQPHANRLLARLRAELDSESVFSMLQEVVAFLADLKKSAEAEHKSLEEFLTDLSLKLIELEQRAVGMRELTQATETGSAQSYATFVDHVEHLRSSASSATDLHALKELLRSRLEVISDYLKSEREVELQRIKEAENCVAQLTGRLQALETESADLQIKLRMEHSMAMRDCLTSLPNRMAYNERIEQEVARRNRFHQPFCLLMWDVDHFKSVNDRFGHNAGDRALVTIGETLASSIRETDFVARFGGEEFVMILVGADRDRAMKVADGIRVKVENCGFNDHGRPVQITISCGLSEFGEGDTVEALFERADQCLYRAKNEGRNRCVAG